MMGKPAGSAPLRVGIAFPIHANWFQHTLRGITHYAKQNGEWLFVRPLITEALAEQGADVVEAVDGIITHSAAAAQVWRARGIPVIQITAGAPIDPSGPAVAMDQQAIGRMVADEFLAHGFSSLACFSTAEASPVWDYARQRVEGFVDRCREARQTVSVFVRGARTLARGRWMLADQLADLTDFLVALPKPIGLMPFDAEHANRAVFAVQVAGLRIPDDVAIICAGDDAMSFGCTQPTISGVEMDTERLGWDAARLLHQLIRREPVPRVARIAPIGVINRGSSSTFAFADEDVNDAVRYIWDHVSEALEVRTVVSAVAISERTLLRKFRTILGRTPADEIRRSRIETAKRLLRSTSLPLISVASESGFASQSQMTRYLRAAEGLTPAQFRARYRSSGAIV